MARDENAKHLKDLANTVKHIRKEKGLTQEDFLFEDSLHIARVEMGKKDLYYTTFMAIVKKLEMTPVEFFTRMDGIINDKSNFN